MGSRCRRRVEYGCVGLWCWGVQCFAGCTLVVNLPGGQVDVLQGGVYVELLTATGPTGSDQAASDMAE